MTERSFHIFTTFVLVLIVLFGARALYLHSRVGDGPTPAPEVSTAHS